MKAKTNTAKACRKCGSRLGATSKFCGTCGHSIPVMRAVRPKRAMRSAAVAYAPNMAYPLPSIETIHSAPAISETSNLGRTLAVIAIAFLGLGWGVSMMFFGQQNRAHESRVQELSGKVADLNATNGDLSSKLAVLVSKEDEINAKLASTTEQLDGAKSEADKQKSEADKQTAEAARQRASSQQKDKVINEKNDELSVSNQVVQLLADLSDLLHAQKVLYLESKNDIEYAIAAYANGQNESGYAYLVRSVEAARQADAMEPQVNAIMAVFTE